jgi:hypothetical protein
MTAASVIVALGLPADTRVEQRVPKKLLAENGAPTAADKRQINEGIEELLWLAALKPATIGVPAYRDDTREYLEIAILSLKLYDGAKVPRLIELIHRAIPYPIFLILSHPAGQSLSLSHLRWSQGQSGQTVLDGSIVTAKLDMEASANNKFLGSLNIASLPHQHLLALYQGWIDRFEAYAAARLTGSFTASADTAGALRRRAALAEHERLTREIASIRARAMKETQLSRRVEFNLAVRRLETQLQSLNQHL